MAKINLDILKRKQERPTQSIYTDLKLDLKLNYNNRSELNKTNNIADIQNSNNVEAIKNSLVSIMTTSPGEKILNPQFGINFGDLLFLPATEFRAQLIGENILNQIEIFETRVVIVQLGVEADYEQDEYNIDIGFNIPEFSGENFSIRGRLGKSGFITSNEFASTPLVGNSSGSSSGGGGSTPSVGGGY